MGRGRTNPSCRHAHLRARSQNAAAPWHDGCDIAAHSGVQKRSLAAEEGGCVLLRAFGVGAEGVEEEGDIEEIFGGHGEGGKD